MAALSRATLTPWPRISRRVKKHVIDQTGWSSTGFKTRERASRGYSLRGSKAIHPTASSRLYANKPGTVPDPTIDFCAARLPSYASDLNSLLGSFQNMHQQPPH